jgi:hypothetical protein
MKNYEDKSNFLKRGIIENGMKSSFVSITLRGIKKT